MELFRAINDAWAIVRLPKGVQKQVKLYTRKTRVYVPHAGGYVEIRGQEPGGESHYTSHPDIKVLEMDAKLEYVKDVGLRCPRYTGDA